MPEARIASPELPNLVTVLAGWFKDTPFAHSLFLWQAVIFSFLVVCFLSALFYFAFRKPQLIPEGLQNAVEAFVSLLDDFICGILGHQGRKYLPFIGTLFIYIIFMNLLGLVPFMKSSTSSWSTTLALALCVFVYVQYAGFKELGFRGYFDHLMGKPRGFLAFSVVIPLLMLFIHIISEFIRPISLSLRLRSNIWGDDMLLAIMAGFGLKGIPMLLFNSLLAILAGVVQAVVFCLLTTIYFALVVLEKETE